MGRNATATAVGSTVLPTTVPAAIAAAALILQCPKLGRPLIALGAAATLFMSSVQPLLAQASLLDPVHDMFCLHCRFWLKTALLKSLM